jgi:ribosomal protein S18 acetylase RimI-like enzyme
MTETHRPARLEFRTDVREDDCASVRTIIESSGFFSAAEVDIAEELVVERLQRGEASGYLFIFAEQDGRVGGYICYGEIPCTIGSYDLYWIAVHDRRRRSGIGRLLIERMEADLRERRGRLVFLDTSGRDQYAPTWRFYESTGFSLIARIPDFYNTGDDKLIFGKRL